MSSHGGLDPQNVQDWSRTALWHVPALSLVTPNPSITFTMGSIDAEVNGVELWPGGMVDYFPRAYNLQGFSSMSSSSRNTIISKSNQVVTTFDAIAHYNHFVSSSYKHYQVHDDHMLLI